MASLARLRTRVPVMAGVLLACVVTPVHAYAGDGTAAKDAGSPAPVAVDYLTDAAAHVQATLAAEKVDGVAQSSGDSGFFQTAVTSSGVELATTKGPSALPMAQLANAAGAVPVHVRVVPNSMATLMAVRDRIVADEDFWKGKGVQFGSWGPDYDSDVVVVHLVKYSAATAADVLQRYGALVSVAAGDTPLATRFNRIVDSSPWYGGDKINAPTRTCSSGFNYVSASGGQYVTTARHCSAGPGSGALPGVNIYNFGNRVAPVTSSQELNNGELDIEFGYASSIGGKVGGIVWSGSPTSASLRHVISVATADPIRGVICMDGAITGEVCGVTILSVGACVPFSNGVTTCGLVVASKPGAVIGQGGDSGGPVETTIGSTQTEARGEMIGGAADPHEFDTNFYTPIRLITRAFNVTVKLG